MIENPSQGIKNYGIGDVYTPGDSNSRRARMPFDFVITQEQLANYRQAHNNPGTIDLGALILCNADGSDGSALATLLDRPISIYIDAETTSITFVLSSTLIGDDKIFTAATTSAARSGYSGGTLVHIYSRTGYKIPQLSIEGTIAIHSDPETPVTIVSAGLPASQGCGWNGVFKIGTFRVQGADINNYMRPGWTGSSGLTVVYEKCLSGHLVWNANDGNPAACTVEPGVVCAPWMSPATDSWIDTDEDDWVDSQVTPGKPHWFGLSYKIDQVFRYGGTPKLRIASSTGEMLCLEFASQKGTLSGGDAVYTFSNGHKTVTVNATDDITLGSGTAGAHIILTDFDVKRDVPYIGGEFDFDSTSGLGKCTLLRENGDFEELDAEGWAGNLDFGDSDTLDWYLWYAYHGHIVSGNTAAAFAWELNTRIGRYIEAATLTEGKVYEINIHIVALPSGGPYVTGGITWGQWASPVTKLVDSTHLDQDALGAGKAAWVWLYFKSGLDTVTPYYWGGNSAAIGGPVIYPDFRAPAENSSTPYTSLREQRVFTELAAAKVQFVKLDGHVYIMAY